MKITLSSDNPNIGGVPIKDTILALAGLSSKYKLPKQVYPLKAEELAILCRNGIDAIFSADHIKQDYKNLLNTWIEKHNLDQEFINNYYGQN
jgi:adenosine deaminase